MTTEHRPLAQPRGPDPFERPSDAVPISIRVDSSHVPTPPLSEQEVKAAYEKALFNNVPGMVPLVQSSPALTSTRDQVFVSTEKRQRAAVALGVLIATDCDLALLWVLDEFIVSVLPEHWREARDSNGVIYYFNEITRQSTWEHPRRAYYSFVHQQLTKMFKPGKAAQVGPKSKHRLMVDLLWKREVEASACSSRPTPPTDVTAGDINTSAAPASARSSFSSTLSAPLDPTTTSTTTTTTTATTPSPAPRAPSPTASAAAGSKKASSPSSPAVLLDDTEYLLKYEEAPTPEEVLEMARFLGISLPDELYLLPIAKKAVTAVVPDNWDVHYDDAGREYYHDLNTGVTTYSHPMDAQMAEEVASLRQAYSSGQLGLDNRQFEWLSFVDMAGVEYHYSFVDHTVSYAPLPTLIPQKRGSGCRVKYSPAPVKAQADVDAAGNASQALDMHELAAHAPAGSGEKVVFQDIHESEEYSSLSWRVLGNSKNRSRLRRRRQSVTEKTGGVRLMEDYKTY